MIDVLIWSLKVLWVALVGYLFVGAAGCFWINHWFKKKEEQAEKAKKELAESLKGMKNLVDIFGDFGKKE